MCIMLRRGKENARVLLRARVLLKSHEGKTDAAIAEALTTTVRTVSRIRERFATGDLIEPCMTRRVQERLLFSRPKQRPASSPSLVQLRRMAGAPGPSSCFGRD